MGINIFGLPESIDLRDLNQGSKFQVKWIEIKPFFVPYT